VEALYPVIEVKNAEEPVIKEAHMIPVPVIEVKYAEIPVTSEPEIEFPAMLVPVIEVKNAD